MSAADDRRLESIGIITSLRRGTVPDAGLARLAVGLETEESVISDQLEFTAAGHADCKFIRGEYGSGKTFV
ncbi:MAG: ATP-binding protein, partial [Lachnospiraceae bacterium]|nr:ATP-binding protein [Lachnospiraceae bacterium]